MTISDDDKIRFANMVIQDRMESIEMTISPGIPFDMRSAFRNFLAFFKEEITLELVSGAYTIEDELPIIYGAIVDQFWDWVSCKFDNPFEWDRYPTPPPTPTVCAKARNKLH